MCVNSSNLIVDISKLRLFSKVTIKWFHTSIQFFIVDPSHCFMRHRLISNIPILSIPYIETTYTNINEVIG